MNLKTSSRSGILSMEVDNLSNREFKEKPVHTGLYLVRIEESSDESPLSFFIGVFISDNQVVTDKSRFNMCD